MTQDQPGSQDPPPPAPRSQGPQTAPAHESFWSIVWRTATRTAVIAVVGGIAFVIGMVVFFATIAAFVEGFSGDDDPDELDTSFVYGDRDADARLLIIRVDGVILGERQEEALFAPGNVYGYEIKEQFRKAAEDEDIDGVLLALSTPGGTIFGSEAIAAGVEQYQEETGKPVVAHVQGLSASGGVWAMAPADRILADHGSTIGSIGVISGPFEFYDGPVARDGGLLESGITTTDGISVEYITAGRGKDAGNPYRPLTDEERATFQASVDNNYEAFVTHVAEARDIPPERIREEMGALVFDNTLAEEYGLIDGTASAQAAYEELASLAGLDAGTWRVEEIEPGGVFGGLFSGDGDDPDQAAESCFARGTTLVLYGDPAGLCWR